MNQSEPTNPYQSPQAESSSLDTPPHPWRTWYVVAWGGAGLTVGILGTSALSFTLGFLGTGFLVVFSEPIHLSIVVLGGALAGTVWGVLMGIRRGAAVAEKYSTVRGRRQSLSETGSSRGIPNDG